MEWATDSIVGDIRTTQTGLGIVEGQNTQAAAESPTSMAEADASTTVKEQDLALWATSEQPTVFGAGLTSNQPTVSASGLIHPLQERPDVWLPFDHTVDVGGMVVVVGDINGTMLPAASKADVRASTVPGKAANIQSAVSKMTQSIEI